jgi:hypothetical protein
VARREGAAAKGGGATRSRGIDDVPRGEKGGVGTVVGHFKGGSGVEQWGAVRGCTTRQGDGGESWPDRQSTGASNRPDAVLMGGARSALKQG